MSCKTKDTNINPSRAANAHISSSKKGGKKRNRSSPGETPTSTSIRVPNRGETIQEEDLTNDDRKITHALAYLLNTIAEKATTPLIQLINDQKQTIEHLTITLTEFVTIDKIKQTEISELKNQIKDLQNTVNAQQNSMNTLSTKMNRNNTVDGRPFE